MSIEFQDLPSAAAAGSSHLGDFRVNRMGYGTMRLSGPNIMGPPRDHDEAVRVLRAAVAAGVNHIDTSDYYGPYTVNRLIHEALSPYPDDLVLVTKVGARRDDAGHWLPATGAAELRSAVEDNLRNLALDAMPVVNLRMADADGSEFTGSLAEQFSVLAELQQAGKIQHLGVSNVGLDQLEEARAIAPVVCVQNAYNVADRRHDALVDHCQAAGIAFVPFFPLGGFTPFQANRFGELAAEEGASTMQLALAWLLARSPAILCIPGTSSTAHLVENLQAASLGLSQRVLDELNSVAD